MNSPLLIAQKKKKWGQNHPARNEMSQTSLQPLLDSGLFGYMQVPGSVPKINVTIRKENKRGSRAPTAKLNVSV